jgi:RNA polymerase sigma factor (sigma-70 family)
MEPIPHSTALTSAMFGTFVEETQGRLCGYIRQLVRDPEIARDIAQTAYLGAWRQVLLAQSPFLQADDPAQRRSWLFREASYRTKDYLRHRARHRWLPLETEEIEPAEPATFFEPTRFEDRIAEGEVLDRTLASLAGRDAACLVLKLVEGFTCSQLVNILGFPTEGAVKKALTRAKARFRKEYYSHNAGPEGQVPG